MTNLLRLLLLALVATLAGCGRAETSASNPGSPDGGTGAGIDAGVFPAPHAAAPWFSQNSNGKVLANPTLIPIFYPGDPWEGTVMDFLEKLVDSPYWKATTFEYGVGHATVAPAVHLLAAAPASISAAEIAAWIARAEEPLPTPGRTSLYLVFFPSQTVVTGRGTSCVDFDAYHDAKKGVPFAVVPRCEQFRDLSGLDVLTVAASHQILNASTDPVPDAPAYELTNGTDWAVAIAGKTDLDVGDMCDFQADSVVPLVGTPYLVQRSWSNEAAAASHDPCAPSAASVHFGAAPVTGITYALEGNFVQGVAVPAGQSRTIELQLFSDAPTSGPFTIEVEAGASPHFPGTPGALSFALDKNQGQNGDVVHLTITRSKTPGRVDGQPFVITSTLGDRKTRWFSVVGDDKRQWADVTLALEVADVTEDCRPPVAIDPVSMHGKLTVHNGMDEAIGPIEVESGVFGWANTFHTTLPFLLSPLSIPALAPGATAIVDVEKAPRSVGAPDGCQTLGCAQPVVVTLYATGRGMHVAASAAPLPVTCIR